jgi:uncharacterized caspase-like protein/outer membrane protein assembly factor BamB
MKHLVILAWALLLLVAGFSVSSQAEQEPHAAHNLTSQFEAGRRWAVVIGVNEYLDPSISNLRYCVADARLVAETLVNRCGYDQKHVLLLTDDQDRAHLRPLRINLDKQLRGWLSHARPGDTVFIFFSGHGFLDARGQGFLVPQDADRNNPGLTAFRTEDLRDILRQCSATQKLLVLDCCHSGGEKDARPFGSSSQELGEAFARAEGLITLASCRKAETSIEWTKVGHGLFTYALTKALRGKADYDKNGFIDSDEVYRYAIEEVPALAQRECNARQTPVRIIGEDTVGIFALARVAQRATSQSVGTTGNTPWPMWAGGIHRNMAYSGDAKLSDSFSAVDVTQRAWVVPTGPSTYTNPIIANGRIFIGTGNKAQHDPRYVEDLGCLLAMEASTGKLLWQLSSNKLPEGRVHDWPMIGITSTPCVEGDYLWLVTNRSELLCLDVQGFHDGENDGLVQDEPDQDVRAADIVWRLDMIRQLGVSPHNSSSSSPVVYRDKVYVLASNGVDESHLHLPAPNAPSFLAVDKKTGRVAWAARPEHPILHGQWSSPSLGEVNGTVQVYFAGGDGCTYAHDANTGERIWKFDGNPPDSQWRLGGSGSRNSIIATPVFYENSVIVGMG